MADKILAALRQLDTSNDNHWTAEGMPRLETLRALTSDFALSREAVNTAAPGFTRATAMQASASPPSAPEAASAGQGGTPDGASASGADSGAAGADNGEAASDVAGAADTQADAGGAGSDGVDELVAAQGVLDAAVAQEATARRALAEASAAVDRILEARTAPGQVAPHAVTLQGYLKSQQELRERRGARMVEMRGIPLADLLPKPAPIDAAFKKNLRRDTKRPTKL